MPDFTATTDFILAHPRLTHGTGFAIEACSHQGNSFQIQIQRGDAFKLSIELVVSGSNSFAASIPPAVLADAIRAGRPLIPQLLAKTQAPQHLQKAAALATYDDMDVFESFTLGDITATAVYESAPQAAGTPAGYRFTVRAPGRTAKHFGISAFLVALSIENSQPLLGYALDSCPPAAQCLAEWIGASLPGMASAYQQDVDRDALVPTPSAQSSGKKPPI